jgi:hypothetical protein
MPESLWKRIAQLALEIESFELERLELAVSPEFTRVTTVVHLRGHGEEGVGEDVTYGAREQGEFQQAGPKLPLAGSWTLESFSAHLDGLTLFPSDPDQAAYRDYRRWAIESSALDLALRQAGTSRPSSVSRGRSPTSPPCGSPSRRRSNPSSGGSSSIRG